MPESTLRTLDDNASRKDAGALSIVAQATQDMKFTSLTPKRCRLPTWVVLQGVPTAVLDRLAPDCTSRQGSILLSDLNATVKR
ncbi:hypothetical protein DYB32_006013 [Aphanomyces invadans]|uniref:Uncharacterized protein n=1 Tax=Aphanomyces invadans TaxID=157072 RepID=A0A418ASX8_9STRA|nr:hypothetical protein DYB32_006013 [Aphanomyces invadans]